jgi:hypothetical protein
MYRLAILVSFLVSACASTPAGDSNACVTGTYTGNLVLTGTGVGTYAGQCTVKGSVTIKNTATADEIAEFQRVQTVDGTLYLSMASQSLDLPALQKVSGTLNLDGSCHLTVFSAPALTTVQQLQVAGATELTSFSAPNLDDSGNAIQFSGNPVLTKLALGVKALKLNLLILDNPLLAQVDLSRLTSVSALKICDNPALTSLASLADAVVITGVWSIANDAALDAKWLEAFKASHSGNFTDSCK